MKKSKFLAVLLVICTIASMVMGCSANKTASANEAADSKTSEPKNRLEEIIARGYIEVATEPYFAPYEFIDPSKSGNEQYVGSDIKLAQYIADELGVELKIVPLEFSAVLSSITEGKYDLAISALSYTPARALAMNMSKGYYFSSSGNDHGLLIRTEDAENIKTSEDIKDKVIVAQSGSLQELFVNEQVPGYKEFKRVSATTDGFLMVQEKKADVCATSIPTAQLYIEANKDSGLMIVEGFKFFVDEKTSGTRIGIPLGEEELTDKVNAIIDEVVKSGTFEQWHKEYSEYAKSLGL